MALTLHVSDRHLADNLRFNVFPDSCVYLSMTRTLTLALLLVAASSARAQTTSDTVRLSIEDAVGISLRNAEETRIAGAQVEIADAQVAIARSSALPQLRLTGGYTYLIASARGQAVGQFFAQRNTYTTQANLSQTLFQGGREFAATRAATRVRSAARLSAEETRARVSVDVQRAYLEALLASRLLDIETSNYHLASNRLTQIEQFAGAGRAARYDVLRARVERTNLEPRLIQTRAARELALLELKRLVNVPLAAPLVLTTAIDTSAVRTFLTSFGEDSLDSGQNRASVRAAELIARARRDALTVARADRYPALSVFANFGYQAFPLTGFPTHFGQIDQVPTACAPGAPADSVCTRGVQNGGWFSDRSVGVQVSWPIFDGLRTEGNIDLAAAQARLAELQLRQERENVAVEVASARAEFERARSFYAAQQQNAGEADETFRLASLRFSRGLSTQLEVADAQLALLTAETNQAQAVFDLYLATAELARAAGRPIPFPPTTSPTRLSTTESRAQPTNP
jgi:outer membrane protein TolC